MDPDTLTLLLRGGHINMPDRIAGGLWPHPPLRFSEVLDHLGRLLEENKWFPREWHQHKDGDPVDERATIERLDTGGYVYRSARAYATQPSVLAETGEHVFPRARDAAGYFLKWDLHLPGDLDGWRVIE